MTETRKKELLHLRQVMSCQESESYSEELELGRGKKRKGTPSVITQEP